MRVIIAEDEFIIALSLSSILKKLGHEVLAQCRSGSDCVKAVERLAPDLVFMDICMETPTAGLDAARIITDTWATPVVFTTAYDDADTLKAAELIKPRAFLVKPLSPEDIVAVLN